MGPPVKEGEIRLGVDKLNFPSLFLDSLQEIVKVSVLAFLYFQRLQRIVYFLHVKISKFAKQYCC